MSALLFLVTATLISTPTARAQDSREAAAEEPVFTAQGRLAEAIRLYQTGNAHEAQTALARLVNDPAPLDESLRQQARLYLGEVLYLQKNKEEARRFFEAILQRDASFTIDPFQHPPDVCGFFETIRAYMRPPTTPTQNTFATGPIPRMPASAYYGFGIYQLQHGNKGLGTAMVIGQTAMAALSIASFGGLLDNRSWETDGDLKGLRTKRTIQWGSTAGFYAFWIWGSVNASQHWRANVHLQAASSGGKTSEGDTPKLHIGFTIPTR